MATLICNIQRVTDFWSWVVVSHQCIFGDMTFKSASPPKSVAPKIPLMSMGLFSLSFQYSLTLWLELSLLIIYKIRLPIWSVKAKQAIICGYAYTFLTGTFNLRPHFRSLESGSCNGATRLSRWSSNTQDCSQDVMPLGQWKRIHSLFMFSENLPIKLLQTKKCFSLTIAITVKQLTFPLPFSFPVIVYL